MSALDTVPCSDPASGSVSGHRVKLCAIAQNEGASLVDWIHHHLHLGFDAVEVWVNGSTDPSVRVMEAICAVRSDVSFRVVDKLLEDSVRRGKYFQHRAYARMARKARQEGFTHAAFLDLDEYWVPADLTSSVHDFLPGDDEVVVVSFPWVFDLPDLDRAPFSAPVGEGLRVVANRHVKSVVRLDDRLERVRPHTALVSSGRRLLLREEFPMPPGREAELQWGSFLPEEEFAARRGALPEAFVLHALNRSHVEYLASLKKAHRRSEAHSSYRTNRDGYLPAPGPVLPVHFPAGAVAALVEGRERFRRECGTEQLVEESRRWILDRAAEVEADLLADPRLVERMLRALRGVPAPRLDAKHPGWATHLEWWVDGCAEVIAGAATAGAVGAGPVEVRGWAFSRAQEGAAVVEFALRGGDGTIHAPAAVAREERSDVVAMHPEARLGCGYRVLLPSALHGDPAVRLLARAEGAPLWQGIDLDAHLRRVPVWTNPDVSAAAADRSGAVPARPSWGVRLLGALRGRR